MTNQMKLEETFTKLVRNFPTNEASARGIKSTDFEQSLFNTRTDESGETFITLPKNLESFSDSLLMLSILRTISSLKWTPVVSSEDLKKGILSTTDGEYFCGYVAKATSHETETGPREYGSSKFSKGIQAYQHDCIESHVKINRSHLRSVQHSIGKKLASMTGFTKEYWGLRAAISSIFKQLPRKRVSHLHTWLLPKEELEKQVVKHRMPFENGGVYLPEEILYFREHFKHQVRIVNDFHNRLNKQDEELALQFWELYSPVREATKEMTDALGNVFLARARLVFPQGKSKRTVAWAKKPLLSKVEDLSEDGISEFMPIKLPGFKGKLTQDLKITSENIQEITNKYQLPSDLTEKQIKVVCRYEELVTVWVQNQDTK
jgi:hypothetical protein